MTTKPKLSDMTGYEADDVMVIERKTYEELLAALKSLELFMSQCGYFNSPDGRKLALQTRAAIAKAEGK